MTTQTLRKERGFLNTGLRVRGSARHRPAGLGSVLRETGEMLRGAFEAPVRQALQSKDLDALADLDEATRRDIGL